jgi:hypothetical protein
MREAEIKAAPTLKPYSSQTSRVFIKTSGFFFWLKNYAIIRLG